MKAAKGLEQAFPLLMGVLCLAFLQSCIFGLFEDKKSGNPDYRRFFVVTVDGSPEFLYLDSTYKVEWTPINAPKEGTVNLSLYHGDSWIGTIADSVPNNGAFAWNLSETKKASGNRMIMGLDFKVRVTSDADTGAWDNCPAFIISPPRFGYIRVLPQAPGVQFRKNSTIKIAWQTDLGPGVRYGIQLLKDTALAATVGVTDSGADSISWRIPTTLPDGAGYRFRVFNVDNPIYESVGPGFTVLPVLTGGYTITAPKEGDTLRDWGTVNISWTTTGKPGETLSLNLHCDSAAPTTLAAMTYRASGTYSWSLGPGYPSGSRCRIRIASLEDTALSAYSGYFSIKGTDRDAFEDDDDRSRAKLLAADGQEQRRSLTSRDKDWIRIEATQGRGYLAPIRTSMNLDAFVYDSAGAQVSRYTGQGIRISFEAAYTGHYHLLIAPINSYGTYQIALADADSLHAKRDNRSSTGTRLPEGSAAF